MNLNPLHIGGRLALERPARKQSLTELADQLAISGRTIAARTAALPDIPHNRRLLSHIIGIERWGHSRLRVLLGEPFVRDEYDRYRPSRETSWLELQAHFQETRAQTVALVRQIEAAGEHGGRVLHNQWGELNLRGWLRYLNVHADLESRKMKQAA